MSVDFVNQIICGECSEVMSKWPDECIDLTVTSPPYDNLRTYNGYVFPFKDIAQQLYRITKKGGVVVWVVSDATIDGSESGTSFKQALYFKEIGFNIHDTMIYHKNNPPPVCGNNRYYSSFEYMFVFSKNNPVLNPILEVRRNKYNDKRTSRVRPVTRNEKGVFTSKNVLIRGDEVKLQNVWSYIVSGGASSTDKVAYQHPAIFPEQLANDHIISWSNEGDVILDPFIGSGTTAIAAIKTNRQFIGIDISQEYCELARKRINNLLNQQSLDFGNNVKYEMIEAVSHEC